MPYKEIFSIINKKHTFVDNTLIIDHYYNKKKRRSNPALS